MTNDDNYNIISESIYIDPQDCDSQISFKINRVTYHQGKEKNLTASVLLSDCTRRIDWYFNQEPDSIKKLDRAINMLQKFKRHLVAESKKIGAR